MRHALVSRFCIRTYKTFFCHRRVEFSNFHRAKRLIVSKLARACVSRTEDVAAKERREEDRAERKRIQVGGSELEAQNRGETSGMSLGWMWIHLFGVLVRGDETPGRAVVVDAYRQNPQRVK